MLEEDIDISAEKPKILTTEAVQASDVVITMGCGDTCPIFRASGTRTGLEDPAGQGVESVRPIRDEIKQRVLTCSRSFRSNPSIGRCDMSSAVADALAGGGVGAKLEDDQVSVGKDPANDLVPERRPLAYIRAVRSP